MADKENDSYLFIENGLKLDDFIRLKDKAFGSVSYRETAKIALEGSRYVIHVEIDGETIGMARLISDGGLVNFIADMIVTPCHQGKGLGQRIMERVMDYIDKNIPTGGQTMIGLFAAKGKEGFYQRFGFSSRTEAGLGHGMQMYLKSQE